MENFNPFFILVAVFETVLAIPLLGGLLVMGSGYTLLFVGFVLHVIVLACSLESDFGFVAPLVGVLFSLVAWIPFVGWVGHVIIAVLYWRLVFQNE